MTITEPQATALANLLHELRPDWPVKSLVTLFGKHRDAGFPELCTTAVTVAADSRNQTPAVIFRELSRQPVGQSVALTGLATGTERAMAAFEVANQFREQEALEGRRGHQYSGQIHDPFARPQIEASR
jgi:hypothetical protein